MPLASADLAPMAVLTPSRVRVLVVDDDPIVRAVCMKFLCAERDMPYEGVEASSPEMALQLLASSAIDCALIDYSMPSMSGTALMHAIRAQRPEWQGAMLLLTGAGNEDVIAEAMRAGASDYLPKHRLSGAVLHRAISNAVEKSRLQQSVRARNQELERANAQLEKHTAEITTFYHRLSHEIKTPLTAIRLFVELLRNGGAGPVTGAQQELLTMCVDSCDALTAQFNDLVDCTRLDNSILKLHKKPARIDRIIQRSLAAVRPAMRSRNITCALEMASGVDRLDCDSGRVVQMITNVLGNAVKFSPRGSSVRLAVERADDPASALEVRVSDEGPGIAPEHLNRIFDRLYQVRRDDEGDDTQTGVGLGLGLTIARDIATLHGGEILVSSTPDVGTTFVMRLPLTSAAA